MTVLERYIKDNDGNWVGGEHNDCIISVKELRSRFSYHTRWHVFFAGHNTDEYKRNVSLKSFSTRREAEVFAEKFACLLNEDKL